MNDKDEKMNLSRTKKLLLIITLSLFSGASVIGQSTAFTYQGSLDDGGSPANGTYDLEFRLFDQVNAGSQTGPTVNANGVTVAEGAFTVTLDFGNQFDGSDRWIEIRVRQSAFRAAEENLGGFTILTPRQRIGSVPYSVKSISADTAINSLQLGGVLASEYVETTDSRLSDARTPLPGSGDYIQNTTTAQPSSDFNISGTGKANIFDSSTDFRILNRRVLSMPGGIDNLVAGSGAGNSINGAAQTTLVGSAAGQNLTAGNFSSFFGNNAGFNTTTGVGNTFIGTEVGFANTTGNRNSLIGYRAGNSNSSGSFNTALGTDADFASGGLSYATAIGAGAVVSASNTIQLGRADESDEVLIPGFLTAKNVYTQFVSADAVTTATEFRIDLDRVLGFPVHISNLAVGRATGTFMDSAARNNVLVGNGAGGMFTTGSDNTIVGYLAGNQNAGNQNSFFGSGAGRNNTGAGSNSVSGNNLGLIIPGNSNSFFGFNSGFSNTAGNNSFFGANSGSSNTTGDGNAFFGFNSGLGNTEGFRNSFFGYRTGENNTLGTGNTFVGSIAGFSNADGNYNSFFGEDSGNFSTTGDHNSFFGRRAGRQNGAGSFNAYFGSNAGSSIFDADGNSFFGAGAGGGTGSGGSNTFLGYQAGSFATYGQNNTAVGAEAGVESNLSYATAIGSEAIATTSNSVLLGRPADRTIVSGELNVLAGSANQIDRGEVNFLTGSGNFDLYIQGGGGARGVNFGVDSANSNGAKLFISQYDGTTYQDRLWMNEFGVISIGTLGLAGATSVCRNASLQFATCSSSIRYKDNIERFSSGSDIISRLRPVTFAWKDSGVLDLGLVAEEVAEIEPLLVTYNTEGQVEGVKYDRIGVVLVNVVKEQADELRTVKAELAALKVLICSANLDAAVCN